MVGSITNVWILIIHSHNQVGAEQVWASKKLFFDRKLFFKGPCINLVFDASYDIVQYIEKVVGDYIFALKKISKSYDMPNNLFGRKRNKSLDFENSLSESGL